MSSKKLASGTGFGPISTESNSAILPLDDPEIKKPPLCSGNESPYKQQSFFFNDKINHLKRHGNLNVLVRNGQNILKPNIPQGNVHLIALGKQSNQAVFKRKQLTKTIG